MALKKGASMAPCQNLQMLTMPPPTLAITDDMKEDIISTKKTLETLTYDIEKLLMLTSELKTSNLEKDKKNLKKSLKFL